MSSWGSSWGWGSSERSRGRGRGHSKGSGYDSFSRREEVRNKLLRGLEAIHKENIHKASKSSGRGKGAQKSSANRDPQMLQLESITLEVDKVEEKIDKFEGPHFTKVYRTLEGDCSKWLLELDKMDVRGREDIRSARRKVMIRIDELGKRLAKKGHDDGRICDLCEIKE